MRLEYFQLIDRVVDLDLAGRTIKAEARVPTTSTIFEGHFPGYPLMPGVLLVETMAQTSGWLLVGLNKFSRMPLLAAVKEAKLRTFVTPGQSLAIRAAIKHEGSGFAVTQAEIRVAGKLVSSAEIMLRLLDFPSAELRASMERTAAAIAFPIQTPTHA
jgi:3-hydroxyacyl-[acyl-carrier-protein] dehydratase